MVFCNKETTVQDTAITIVTILILIDGFLQYGDKKCFKLLGQVTILILIDGFLQ